MSRPTRIKQDALPQPAPAYPVPKTKDETIEAIAEIGRRQRERVRIETAMNDDLAKVREAWEKQAAPHTEAIKALSAGIQLWCELHRNDLTQDGKTKTAKLASGEVKWRLRPPSVTLRAVDNIIATLKQLGLDRFLRIKEEVNKEAILCEPETVQHIKGITITQKEDFVIVPFETELEEIA
jgi:phage host-nuclease inhibitor protein Gam